MEKVEGEIVSTGITDIEYHDREANNRIMGLIDYYKELIKDKGTFIDETVDDVKLSIKIFGAIRDILVELKKLDGFDEQKIEETFQYWSEILETYKNTTMENIDYKNQNSIQSDLDSLIKLHEKDYISKGVSEPNANKGESKSQPVFDIIGTYQRELKRNTDIWNLDSRTNALLNSVNSMIELFETKYILTQEIPKTEVATSTSLMPMPQKSWIKKLFDSINSIMNKLREIFGNSNIIDSTGTEVDANQTVDVIENYLDVEPITIDFNNKKETEEWNKRLIEYKRKIDSEEFTTKDMPSFIRDYATVEYQQQSNNNWIALKESLEKIKSIIAEFYECSEEEVFLGDYDGFLDEREIPYKVIIGDVKFFCRKNRLGSCLEVIIGHLSDMYGSEISELENLQIIYGYADFAHSKLTSLSNLKYIGKMQILKSVMI